MDLPTDITKLIFSYLTKPIYKFPIWVNKSYHERLSKNILSIPRGWYQITQAIKSGKLVGPDPNDSSKLIKLIDYEIFSRLSVNPDPIILDFLFAHLELICYSHLILNTTIDPNYINKIHEYYDKLFGNLTLNNEKLLRVAYIFNGVQNKTSRKAGYQYIIKHIDDIPRKYLGWIEDIAIQSKLASNPDTDNNPLNYWADLSANPAALPLFLMYPHKIKAGELLKNPSPMVIRVIAHLLIKPDPDLPVDPITEIIKQIIIRSGVLNKSNSITNMMDNPNAWEIIKRKPSLVSNIPRNITRHEWFPKLYKINPKYKLFDPNNIWVGTTEEHMKIYESAKSEIVSDAGIPISPTGETYLGYIALSNEYFLSREFTQSKLVNKIIRIFNL